MVFKNKIIRFLKLFYDLIFNFYQGVGIKASYVDFLIEFPNKRFFRNSQNIKTNKNILINSIKSHNIFFNNSSEFIGLNHFSINLKNLLETNLITNWKTIIFLKHSMLYHLWFGSLVNCQFLRNLYRKQIISFQNKQKILNLNAIRAAIEENQIQLIKSWIKKKNFSKFDKNSSKVILNYLKIISHESLDTSALEKSNMLNLVKNKRIIIIGPAYDEEINTKNQYDVCVSANFLSGRDDKVDISYYGNIIKDVGAKKVLTSFKDLEFACVTPEFLKLLNLTPIQALKVRGIEKDLRLLLLNFRSRPNMIQDIVIDLLKHNPKKIYLCGINFYINKKIYRDNLYSKFFSSEKKNKSILENLRVAHDPFSNFIILKNIWINGLIDVSKEVEKIISLSEIEYAKKLEMSKDTFL